MSSIFLSSLEPIFGKEFIKTFHNFTRISKFLAPKFEFIYNLYTVFASGTFTFKYRKTNYPTNLQS